MSVDSIETNRQFFIVGCPRSGTTLLQRMLGAHPDVAVAPETFFMRRLWERREAYGDLRLDAFLDRLIDDLAAFPAFEEMGLDEDEVRSAVHAGDRTWAAVFGALLRQFGGKKGARVVGEKTPNHVLHIDTLRQWFPDAQFIHLVRDPRAVANSWRSVPWSSGYRWRDAEVWKKYVRAGRQAAAAHPEAMTSVHFESLVRSPKTNLQDLCSFLGVDYYDQMLAFHERAAHTVNVEREPWKERATEPVDASVADRWREELSQEEQAEVEVVAASEMQKWGYECECPSWRRWGILGRVQAEWVVWKAGVVLDDLWTRETDDDEPTADSSAPFTLGFLHLGNPEHGVTRYGHVLAEAAKEHLDLRVQDVSLTLADEWEQQKKQLREAARALASCDVVQMQYNQRIWGGPRRAPFTVRTFVDACAPPLVATLHDVRDGYRLPDMLRRLWRQRKSAEDETSGRRKQERGERGLVASGIQKAQNAVQSFSVELGNAWATRTLVRHAAHVLVCTREEARRVERQVSETAFSVIPHFVEERPRDMDQEESKGALGLSGRTVMGVLGYIHRRKGYDLVVESLPLLPEEVQVVFIGQGGKNSQDYAAQLEERAQALGEGDRLRITGYVPEETLNRYLAATDLAVCPFREASASGSLATWIAAERPILASDLPLFREYNDRVEKAIATFSPYTPEALAERAVEVLERPGRAVKPRIRSLRQSLTIDKIVEQHHRVYRRVAGHRKERTS